MTKKLKTLLAIGFLTLASCEDNKTTTNPKLDTKIYTELVTMFDDKYDKIKIKGDPSTFNKFDDTYSFIVEVTNVHPSEHGWKVGDKLKVQATKTEDGWTNQRWFWHGDIPHKGRLPVTKPPITNLVPDGKEPPKPPVKEKVKYVEPKWITGGSLSLTYKNHINDVIDDAVRYSVHISSVTKLYDTYSVMRLAKGHYRYKCKIKIKSNAKGTSASIDKLIEEKGWGVGATIEMTFEKINGQLKNTSIATIDKR